MSMVEWYILVTHQDDRNAIYGLGHAMSLQNVEGSEGTCQVTIAPQDVVDTASAKVKLVCNNHENSTLTYTVEGATDISGTYRLLVVGDHEEDICENKGEVESCSNEGSNGETLCSVITLRVRRNYAWINIPFIGKKRGETTSFCVDLIQVDYSKAYKGKQIQWRSTNSWSCRRPNIAKMFVHRVMSGRLWELKHISRFGLDWSLRSIEENSIATCSIIVQTTLRLQFVKHHLRLTYRVCQISCNVYHVSSVQAMKHSPKGVGSVYDLLADPCINHTSQLNRRRAGVATYEPTLLDERFMAWTLDTCYEFQDTGIEDRNYADMIMEHLASASNSSVTSETLAYSVSLISANLTQTGGCALVAWVRVYGLGCGVLPVLSTRCIREYRFIITIPSRDVCA
ncbi:hypothetical protein DKX38_024166 [Salix brachista]|uniref:Uncharacterized protein n=1 Tax=Salix brachista TaxID=2182728 RepID=A0A5N5JYE4_9ROSI|nr:hypothetical protein DKX38_024166 [Salix brachista]